MENKTTQNTTQNTIKKWTPNEVQKQFITMLKDFENGATLYDIEIKKGATFKTGAINCLVEKGLVATEKIAIQCDIIYKGYKVGYTTKNINLYKLTEKGKKL